MMVTIPGDWAHEDENGKLINDETLVARLAENVTLLVNATQQSESLAQPARFLKAIVDKIEQEADLRAKILDTNHTLGDNYKSAQRDLRIEEAKCERIAGELKAARKRIQELEAAQTLPAVLEIALAPEQVEEIAQKAECNPQPIAWPEVPDLPPDHPSEPPPSLDTVPATPCACVPTDAELAAYVTSVANEHGLDPAHLTFGIGPNGFTVFNNVPYMGRKRGASAPSLAAAMKNLQAELTT
jgi:hypothetical protein